MSKSDKNGDKATLPWSGRIFTEDALSGTKQTGTDPIGNASKEMSEDVSEAEIWGFDPIDEEAKEDRPKKSHTNPFFSMKGTDESNDGRLLDSNPHVLYNSTPKKKVTKRTKAWDGILVEKTYDPSRIEEIELTGAITPSDNEEFDDVKDAIQILRSTERTVVFAIVVDKKNEDNNVMSAIRCNGGTAFGGYARDSARDSYIVQCVEFLQLGSVAFSYVMTMPSAGNWQVKVPIPEIVLEKYFNPQQKKTLSVYRERYPKSNYDIHFIQLMGCH